MSASQATKSTVKQAFTTSEAAHKERTIFQSVKGVLWTTEAIVVASVGFGMYAAYFISRWEPSGRQQPTSANYEEKYEQAAKEHRDRKEIKRTESMLSSYKEKTDKIFKEFKEE
eukprot:CAMPEP_0119057792 /NCGR_PEP_ID=MMETSP1178-20130426/2181_1 /TAXON_ID=33656 /ORGANISM="unid sp, Strain CCMP2000" /LENGTH=113 /DNA_ID=CAMNT_0007038653 /DNA_START=138 /DNA_END=479 /DNA_ORIENTATION=+